MIPVILFDIDGTLADITHRLHHIRPQVGHVFRYGSENVEWCVSDVFQSEKTVIADRVKDKDSECFARRFDFSEIGFKPNWPAFFDAMVDDGPIPEMVSLCEDLLVSNEVIFVSGRPDSHREETRGWLLDHILHFEPQTHLYMRRAGDYRPDHVVKREILGQIRADGHNPILAIDDRKQVVDMWRSEGIRTLQCAEGDY